jgi:radical SAM/Cys-rich protein
MIKRCFARFSSSARTRSVSGSGVSSTLPKSLSLKESIEIVKAREARKQSSRQQLLESNSSSIPAFDEMLKMHKVSPLTRTTTRVIQVNIGKLCNLTCRHCHVESGPTRRENMNEKTIDRIIHLLQQETLRLKSNNYKNLQASPPPPLTVDITGGAPELNPFFRKLVTACRSIGLHVIDRCNLSVLFLPGQEDTAKFLADQGVSIIASLPSTSELAVERQRGRGSWSSSLQGLRLLNSLGFGQSQGEGGGKGNLTLDLIYNPPGLEARLPPPQLELETHFRTELLEKHGIVFNKLFSLTNMPVKRYADDLAKSLQLEPYMNLLALQFTSSVVPKLMCRDTISIAYDGTLYDCDFNQALGMNMIDNDEDDSSSNNKNIANTSNPSSPSSSHHRTLWTIDSFSGPSWIDKRIQTSKVCYGCTAGAGSSCGGALS